MPRDIRNVEDTTVLLPEPTEAFHDAVNVINQEAAFSQTSNDNARAIAAQLHYDGALTVGALEDEIRFYQRRTVEDVLELGKRLLILKELTPHGEFTPRIELLGINQNIARKFMSATLKFSKTVKSTVLNAAGNQSKLLELLVLDDGEISALEDGETVRGLKLDDIEAMGVSELKKALRKTKQTLEATESVIKKKDDKMNEMDREIETLRINKRSAIEEQQMPGEYELMRLQVYVRELTVNIASTLNSEAVNLLDIYGDMPPQHIRLAVAQSLGLIISATQQVSLNIGITPITDPDTAAAADPIWQQVEMELAEGAA